MVPMYILSVPWQEGTYGMVLLSLSRHIPNLIIFHARLFPHRIRNDGEFCGVAGIVFCAGQKTSYDPVG